MSFLGAGGKGSFDRLLESATSQMLLEPSWATNLEICDAIRQKDVSPKYAMTAIRKKIKDPNPHICKFSLVVLETCVKNCGKPFHEELISHDLMDDLRSLAQSGSAPVKEQILYMLQAWNHAFRNKINFQPILATYNLMKMEGYQFPVLSDSDAMFSADAAPEWKDGDVCHMCRVKFSTFTRQHHCRACGEVFCAKCSSKSSIIPKLGIEREVRVCDPCYEEINPNEDKPEAAAKPDSVMSDLPLEYLNSDLAKEVQTKPKLSEAEVKAQEEEEMQLALALSMSEEEASKKTSGKNWSAPVQATYETPKKISEPIKTEKKRTEFTNVRESLNSLNEDNSQELSKYLDRSYWEKKNAENRARQPSAPVEASQPETHENYDQAVNNIDEDESDEEDKFDSSAFVSTMEKSLEMFIDRMQQVQLKGKHIAMDSTIQSLFQSLSAMHPQLITLIENKEESKAKYEAMLEKLSIIREARESLNDMRAQHQEKVRQQELEQEMLRRMQMEQKLELMRQQKQEYLEYQRQLQIQRQQELEVYQQEKLRHKQIPAGYEMYSNQKAPSTNGFSSTPSNGYGMESSLPPQYQSLNAANMQPPSYATVSSQYQPDAEPWSKASYGVQAVQSTVATSHWQDQPAQTSNQYTQHTQLKQQHLQQQQKFSGTYPQQTPPHIPTAQQQPHQQVLPGKNLSNDYQKQFALQQPAQAQQHLPHQAPLKQNLNQQSPQQLPQQHAQLSIQQNIPPTHQLPGQLQTQSQVNQSSFQPQQPVTSQHYKSQPDLSVQQIPRQSAHGNSYQHERTPTQQQQPLSSSHNPHQQAQMNYQSSPYQTQPHSQPQQHIPASNQNHGTVPQATQSHLASQQQQQMMSPQFGLDTNQHPQNGQTVHQRQAQGYYNKPNIQQPNQYEAQIQQYPPQHSHDFQAVQRQEYSPQNYGQYPMQNPTSELSANMKDLQLISFDNM